MGENAMDGINEPRWRTKSNHDDNFGEIYKTFVSPISSGLVINIDYYAFHNVKQSLGVDLELDIPTRFKDLREINFLI